MVRIFPDVCQPSLSGNHRRTRRRLPPVALHFTPHWMAAERCECPVRAFRFDSDSVKCRFIERPYSVGWGTSGCV